MGGLRLVDSRAWQQVDRRSSEWLAGAQRHAAEAYAAAARVLAASAEAFCMRPGHPSGAASMHDRTAAAGTGKVIGHERQATLRWAGRARLLLSSPGRAAPAAIAGEPGGGLAP